MRKTSPSLTTAVATIISVLSFSAAASAQQRITREINPAIWQATPDAAALGPAGRAFLEYGQTDSDGDWLAAAGLGIYGGTLHFQYGQGGIYREYALGYARRLTEHRLWFFGSWGAGMDVAGAYQSGPGWLYNPRSVRLAIPLSLRWGSPSGLSLSPYVAPYAELGRAALSRCDFSTKVCLTPASLRGAWTYSAGLGFGAELTAWRLGLTVGAMGVPDMRAYRPGWKSSAGIRVRF